MWGKDWFVERIIECHSHSFMINSIYEKCYYYHSILFRKNAVKSSWTIRKTEVTSSSEDQSVPLYQWAQNYKPEGRQPEGLRYRDGILINETYHFPAVWWVQIYSLCKSIFVVKNTDIVVAIRSGIVLKATEMQEKS